MNGRENMISLFTHKICVKGTHKASSCTLTRMPSLVPLEFFFLNEKGLLELVYVVFPEGRTLQLLSQDWAAAVYDSLHFVVLQPPGAHLLFYNTSNCPVFARSKGWVSAWDLWRPAAQKYNPIKHEYRTLQYFPVPLWPGRGPALLFLQV